VPRPSQLDQRRRDLIPVVARAFAELGFRRASTAELAARCGVRENILYRLWPDKKAMFIAAIDFVFDASARAWAAALAAPGSSSPAEKVLAYESQHSGEFGHARIVFAGLSETDDADIRAALARMYRHYHAFLRDQVAAHRHHSAADAAPADAVAAWAFIGLGTVALIARELKLLGERDRRRLMTQAGQALLQ